MSIDKVQKDLEKKYGKGAVVRMNDEPQDIEVIPTGNIILDMALGVGGYPRGRIVEIYGPESCIAGNTHLNYRVRRPDGTSANNKGGTIKQLWKRFHRVSGGSGNYQRPGTEDYWYSIVSADEDGVLRHNKIIDVVNTGEQVCYEVTTETARLTCTADHRFWTEKGYTKLADLRVGDLVGIHDKTGTSKTVRVDRPDIYTAPNHPVAATKTVTENGVEYVYSRIRRSRAVMEAHLNQMSFDEYKQRLDDGTIDGMKFLPRTVHVHHLNEDATDDRLENLALIDPSEHGKHHAADDKMRYTISTEEIESITEIGMEETFDLKMADPYRNYVAGRFVTHNSGKTTLATHAAAEAQKLDLNVGYIDAEHAIDPTYTETLGVNLNDILLSQPDSGEQGLQIAEDMIKSGEFGLIVVDSVAALTPRAELAGEMGDSHVGLQARLMGQALRKIRGIANTTGTTIIFINQIREKIGVMFGSPETTPGGRALKFYSTIRLDIRRIGSIKSGVEIVGNETRVKVVKNKVAPPFRQAEFDIMYGKGASQSGSIIDLGVEEDLISKSGAWYTIGEEQVQGREAAKEALEANPELMAELYEKLAYEKEEEKDEDV